MANHNGFIFMAPDGRYLERRVFMSHGPNDRIVWAFNAHLDAAHLFPSDRLDTIRPGDAFEDIAVELDVGLHQLSDVLTCVPAHSVQRIEIGHEE